MKKNLTPFVFILFLDVLAFPFTIIASCWFRLVKFLGVSRMPLTKWTYLKVGVFPIVDHYYEPLFNFDSIDRFDKRVETLFDLRVAEQLKLLNELTVFSVGLKQIPINKTSSSKFYLNNGSFVGFDAYFLFAFVKHIRPQQIIEVGSGFSTQLILDAISTIDVETKITCIEPFEMPQLENLPVKVIRSKVEKLDRNVFLQLKEGDILFIDSSHIVRPQGDVLFEILEILPRLNKGVYIHFHDIFIPYDYPESWLKKEFRLWNEQYLLQAFLSYNEHFEVVFTTHFSCREFSKEIKNLFPFICNDAIGGCSFWIRKVK